MYNEFDEILSRVKFGTTTTTNNHHHRFLQAIFLIRRPNECENYDNRSFMLIIIVYWIFDICGLTSWSIFGCGGGPIDEDDIFLDGGGGGGGGAEGGGGGCIWDDKLLLDDDIPNGRAPPKPPFSGSGISPGVSVLSSSDVSNTSCIGWGPEIFKTSLKTRKKNLPFLPTWKSHFFPRQFCCPKITRFRYFCTSPNPFIRHVYFFAIFSPINFSFL